MNELRSHLRNLEDKEYRKKKVWNNWKLLPIPTICTLFLSWSIIGTPKLNKIVGDTRECDAIRCQIRILNLYPNHGSERYILC